MIKVYQVCRSWIEGDDGLGGGGCFCDPVPYKTFSSRPKALAFLKKNKDPKEWRIKWSIKILDVY
jgi:hypothetical protein